MKFNVSKKVLSVGIAATVAALGLSISPAFASSQATLDPEGLVPQLSAGQDSESKSLAEDMSDRLTAMVDPDSVRVLLEDQGNTYAAGIDKTGTMVCFIITMGGKEPITGTACMPTEEFAHTPISLGLVGSQDSGARAAAYLVQSDVDTSPLTGAPARKGLTNGATVILDEGDGSLPDHQTLERKEHSSKYEFFNLNLVSE